MKWTTERPTQPGVYWHDDYKFEPTIVEIKSSLTRGLVLLEPGSESECPLSVLSDCRWYGPLTPPNEE